MAFAMQARDLRRHPQPPNRKSPGWPERSSSKDVTRQLEIAFQANCQPELDQPSHGFRPR